MAGQFFILLEPISDQAYHGTAAQTAIKTMTIANLKYRDNAFFILLIEILGTGFYNCHLAP